MRWSIILLFFLQLVSFNFIVQAVDKKVCGKQLDSSCGKKIKLLIEKNKKEKAGLYECLAGAYIKAKLYQDAANAYLKVIELTPENSEIYYYLGLVNHYYLINPVAAEKFYKKYLNSKPQGKYITETKKLIKMLNYDQ